MAVLVRTFLQSILPRSELLRSRRWLSPFVSLVVAILALITNTAAQSASPEYKVKAVFLFNFAQFVEWPASAFRNVQDPIVIGILGVDPFGSFLDETVKGETVGGRRLIVRRFTSADQAAACQILFISQSEISKIKGIFASLKGKPVLTVGESEGFATRGGMIRFIMEQNRIRLRINLESVQESNLTISSKLLRAAEIVKTKTE